MTVGVIAVKSKFIQYYVEGPDDKKVVDTLKTEMGLVRPGKVHVLNVVAEEITDLRLRTLSPGTMVVLVFDVDAGNIETLKKNIQNLKAYKAVSEIVTITQVPKLEGELVRSCNIRQIKELLNSRTNEDFKRDVMRVTNLGAKLREHKFNIDQFWSATPTSPYQDIPNQASKVKLKGN